MSNHKSKPSKAACFKCETIQNIKYEQKDVPFSDDSAIVKNILVGVCIKCDLVILIPNESTPEIRKAYLETRESK
tara:strand:+ start:2287 stop:2511 length:225 start_codon:yes stop_codon:yes gene_type:complete